MLGLALLALGRATFAPAPANDPKVINREVLRVLLAVAMTFGVPSEQLIERVFRSLQKPGMPRQASRQDSRRHGKELLVSQSQVDASGDI
jgi:hypothetical protein